MKGQQIVMKGHQFGQLRAFCDFFAVVDESVLCFAVLLESSAAIMSMKSVGYSSKLVVLSPSVFAGCWDGRSRVVWSRY